jgi:hypothetical protein
MAQPACFAVGNATNPGGIGDSRSIDGGVLKI